jgi:hypothetical protein
MLANFAALEATHCSYAVSSTPHPRNQLSLDFAPTNADGIDFVMERERAKKSKYYMCYRSVKQKLLVSKPAASVFGQRWVDQLSSRAWTVYA